MQKWSAIISLVILPICYVVLCTMMRERRIERPPYVPLFFLFGNVGGWFLALLLSPSGLAATCLVFLMTVAPASTLLASFRLLERPERTGYHRFAMWGGFSLPALFCIPVLLILLRGG